MTTYLINREDRPERLRHAFEELKAQDLNARVFKAFATKPGWKGCRDSHLAIMERCRSDVVFLVLEDDVHFLGRYHDVIEQAVMELPHDWDMLLLGANPQEPLQRYSDHLYRMGKAFCTHAILWHTREGGALDYILSHKREIKKIDVFFAEAVYPNFNCFLISPLLCTQTQFPSDTCKRSDVSQIESNYSRFCI